MSQSETQKIIVVQSDYCGGSVNKSYIDAIYEVEARVTPRCFIFKWGGQRSLTYKAKRCSRSSQIAADKYGDEIKYDRTSWWLANLSDGRRIQAYTPEHWDKVKHLYLTLEQLSDKLLENSKCFDTAK